MNRLQKLFADRPSKLLSVFYTAGFPTLGSTVIVGKALSNAGADIIEVGIPFSDPVADGPAIQESNKIALENGMNVTLLLQHIKQLRQEVSVPIILMGYLNPVLQYGFEKFCTDCAASGVDGLILPDLPLDVYLNEYKAIVENSNLSMTFLISPTTSEDRIRIIDGHTNSFIYAVSASSTTGAKQGFADEQVAYFKRIAAMKLKNPYLIGFGISNPQTFKVACEHSSGAIIGSVFINKLKSSTNTEADVASFIKDIRGNH